MSASHGNEKKILFQMAALRTGGERSKGANEERASAREDVAAHCAHPIEPNGRLRKGTPSG